MGLEDAVTAFSQVPGDRQQQDLVIAGDNPARSSRGASEDMWQPRIRRRRPALAGTEASTICNLAHCTPPGQRVEPTHDRRRLPTPCHIHAEYIRATQCDLGLRSKIAKTGSPTCLLLLYVILRYILLPPSDPSIISAKAWPQGHGSSPPPRRLPSGQLLTSLRSQDPELPICRSAFVFANVGAAA
jgi:hypothetical protein